MLLPLVSQCPTTDAAAFTTVASAGISAGVPSAHARLRHTFQIIGAATIEITFEDTEVCEAMGAVDCWCDTSVKRRSAVGSGRRCMFALRPGAQSHPHPPLYQHHNHHSIPIPASQVKVAGGLQGWLDSLPTFSVPKLPAFLQVGCAVRILVGCMQCVVCGTRYS